VIVKAQPQEDGPPEIMFPQSLQVAVEECLPTKRIAPEKAFDGEIMAAKLAPVGEYLCDGICTRRSGGNRRAGKSKEKLARSAVMGLTRTR
jgi:hypothetical protein